MALKKEDKQLLITAGIAVGGYYFVLKPILEKLGVIKSAKAELIDQEKTALTGSPFNPNTWKNTPGAMLIQEQSVQSMINTIQDSFGVFADNYAAVLAVFKQLSRKSQVSYLADRFQQKTGFDLLEFLSTGGGILPWDGLSETHLAAIVSYANSLPS